MLQRVGCIQIRNAMGIEQVIAQYRDALGNKDIQAIEELFVPGATVTAPISGEKSVNAFHSYLFANTGKTGVTFSNALPQRSSASMATLQICYTFLTPAGRVGVIDGIAIFDLDQNLNKFKRLRVIYNPTEIRQLMAEEQIPGPDSDES